MERFYKLHFETQFGLEIWCQYLTSIQKHVVQFLWHAKLYQISVLHFHTKAVPLISVALDAVPNFVPWLSFHCLFLNSIVSPVHFDL